MRPTMLRSMILAALSGPGFAYALEAQQYPTDEVVGEVQPAPGVVERESPEVRMPGPADQPAAVEAQPDLWGMLEEAPLPAPTGIWGVRDRDAKVIELHWDPVPNATGYTVWRFNNKVAEYTARTGGLYTQTSLKDPDDDGTHQCWLWYKVTAIYPGNRAATSDAEGVWRGKDGYSCGAG